jgi:hypothetical protein
MNSSLVAGVYDQRVERESAYEMLQAAAQKHLQVSTPGTTNQSGNVFEQITRGAMGGLTGARTRQNDTIVEAMSKRLTRTLAGDVTRNIVRGILGTFFGGRKR